MISPQSYVLFAPMLYYGSFSLCQGLVSNFIDYECWPGAGKVSPPSCQKAAKGTKRKVSYRWLLTVGNSPQSCGT